MACPVCEAPEGRPCRVVRINGRWMDNPPENYHPARAALAQSSEKSKERLS